MSDAPNDSEPYGAVVVTENVTKKWGQTTALAGVSVQFPKGITGLLGENGAGKTTLIGALLGLHRVDEGTIHVLGKDPWTLGPEVRAILGYSPEHDALPPDQRAFDFVRHMAEVHGIPKRSAISRASDVLFLTGLGEERFRPIGTMSTGQKQMVKLAQAIVHDPKLLLLDEPTNGLDPVQRDGMLNLILQIGKELGMDVIVSSHLIAEVEKICDSVVILDSGRRAGGGLLRDLTAPQDELLLEVTGPADSLARTLRKSRLKVRVADGRLLVGLDGDRTYDVIRDALASSSKHGLVRLVRKGASLEDVFLSAGEAES
ncbi:MAG TPA: ABC transporter ATP-binding protein [Actinomycetota bacterium]|nr:ABC transporter ATP-binding protein [Actinomycetota bacterium]